MPPARLRLVLLALAIVAAAKAADASTDDSLPIRRVVLPAAKLPDELKRLKDGVLTRLPRREFEALVRDAARAGRRVAGPRLIEARYRAGLSDSALVGTAQWKVLHGGPGPALLRLTGDGSAFNLAVKQPRFDNREALLTSFPDPDDKGRSLALYLDRPGEHTVTFEWSARAEQRPEGLFLDLRLPACPAASLELELPADRQLSLPDGTPVSGPHPAMAADRRTWRVAAGGKSQLALLLHRGGAAGPLFAWQKMTQRLSPDGVETSSVFTVEAPGGGSARELVCEFDPLLRPVDVQAPAIERWDVAATPGRLTIRLAKPLREGVVEVHCVGPLTASPPADREPNRALVVPWVSPWVRLAGAVSRGEALELLLHPELRLLSWQPGDFRLTDSSPAPDPDKALSFRRLTLQGGGLTSGGVGPRRPGGDVQAGGVEFRAKQRSWWRLGGGAELVCQIDYELRQGQLFQMPLRLPAGWDVEAVETTPADLLRGWGPRTGKGGALLLVDLRRPLRVGPAEAAASLLVRLRQADPPAGAELHFPEVVPLGARFREGGLAIDFDEQTYRAVVNTPLAPGDAGAAGPWGKVVPDYYYPFRGEPLTGTLHLLPRPPRFRARVATEVTLAADRAALDVRVTLDSETGTARFVDVFLSGGDDRAWDWRPARAERLWARDAAAVLAPLGAPPLGAAVLAAGRPAGSSWRLWLDRPLVARQTVTLHATHLLTPHQGQRWDVPLVTVPGAARQDGQVTLHLAGGQATAVERAWLTESPSAGSGRRGYRYTEGTPRLILEARPRGVGPRADAAVESARLTTALTGAGELRHHFRFRLARWPHRALPVKLPVGAKLIAAAVAGEWLGHGTVPDAEGTVALPVPSNPEPALFELVYSTPAATGPAWFRLDAPAPEVPVGPAGFERRWLLPPGVLPVGDAGLALLPGGADDAGPRPAAARLIDLLKFGPAWPLTARSVGDNAAAGRALSDACAGLCGGHGGMVIPLGTAVEELAEALGTAHPLAIDRAALSRAGVGSATRLTVLLALDEGDFLRPWDDEELVLVATAGATLLTTRQQVGTWSPAGPPPGVEAAVAHVAERGQDATGRFVSAVEWLGRARAAPPRPGLFPQGDDLSGWTVWFPVVGATGDRLLVVRREAVSATGVALAGLLAASLVLARRRPARSRSWGLLSWLAVSGLGLAWLPSALAPLAWWPLVAGLLVALPWYLGWAVSRPVPPPVPPRARGSSIVKPAVTAGALLALAVAAGDSAEPARVEAEEGIVFLIPDGDDPTGAVLARPALLDKLRARARPARGPAPGAVLVSASYDGKLAGDRAEFAATFQAHLFGDGPAALELPLDEVQLVGDVLLDGARVLPEALARGGYAVRVVGEGRHKVELRFQVGLSRFGDGDAGRQVRFVAPPLVQSRLAFQLPEGATYPRVAVKHGAMRLGGEGGSRRLEADLGAVASPLQLRWHQETRPAKTPRLEYREAYLWDLRADASLLTALVRYAVRGGAVTSLRIDLPPGLEVRSVQARRPAAGEGKTSGDAVRLSGWSVEGTAEGRAVRLDFPVPVSGEVELTLELAPSAPWGRSVLLPLPRPRGEPEAKTPGYLAYRRQGLEVTRTNWLRLTGLRPAEFAPFWTGSGRPAAATLEYASSFRRDPRQPPELSLAPRPSRPALEATQEVTWQVGPTRAEVAARLDLAAPGKDLCLVEYLIDSPTAVTIAGVTGPDVSRWSQSGSRLLVWLEKAVGATRVELSGWVPLATPRGGLARLDLPCLRPERAAKSATRLVLRPAPGLALGSAVVRQLTAERPGGAGELVYAARQASYGGSFTVQPGPAPTANVVTVARRDGDDLVFVATIDYRFPGEARSLGVRLRGWDGDSWLETPAKTESRRSEQHRRVAGRRERSWALELAPGVTERYHLTLRGRLPLEGMAASVAIPEVLVAGAQTRQLVRVEDGLVVEGAVGVVAEERGWRSAEEGWSLRVAPRQSAAASPVRVLLTEGRSYVADGAHWRHEARLWVRHEGPAELRLRLPVGAESAGVRIDGIPAGVVEGGEAWLPLPGASGVVEVVVHYQFEPRREALEQPELAPPWVEGARSGSLVWTVNVPAGWEATSSSGGTRLGDGPTRRAVVELQRAEAELARGDSAARQRAARSLGLARLALKTGAEGLVALGPDGVPLSRWLADLQARLSEGGEPAAGSPGAEEASHRGTPHSWRQDRAEGGLVIRLAPESRAESRQAVAFSAGWLAALVVAWAVTASATLRSAARWLWPEALVTTALLGGYFAGLTLAVLALAAVGVAGRAAIAGRALRAMTRPPASATTGSSRR